MRNSETIDIQIKKSKNDKPVPIVNGIHLHSAYDPIKESENFVNKIRESLESNSRVLVFGLGFGYHVCRIAQEMEKIHGKDNRVIVLEPFANLVECAKENNKELDSLENVEIFCGENVEDLYLNWRLVDVMTERPAIVPHPASFNFSREFFKKFMGFSACTTIDSILTVAKNENVSRVIKKFETKEDSLPSVIKSMNGMDKKLDSDALILKAFGELCKVNQEGHA